MRYLEDFHPGAVEEFGGRTVTRDEIVAFAAAFDPQPFHLNDEAGARSIYGGLIASGWHTAALSSRMFVDHLLADSTSLGGPGLDELRWLKPVRPGDTLSLRWTVLETTRSKSKPDRGVVRSRIEVLNQAGDTVLTYILIVMFRARGA
jgi:acyl dehydratase